MLYLRVSLPRLCQCRSQPMPVSASPLPCLSLLINPLLLHFLYTLFLSNAIRLASFLRCSVASPFHTIRYSTVISGQCKSAANPSESFPKRFSSTQFSAPAFPNRTMPSLFIPSQSNAKAFRDTANQSNSIAANNNALPMLCRSEQCPALADHRCSNAVLHSAFLYLRNAILDRANPKRISAIISVPSLRLSIRCFTLPMQSNSHPQQFSAAQILSFAL